MTLLFVFVRLQNRKLDLAKLIELDHLQLTLDACRLKHLEKGDAYNAA